MPGEKFIQCEDIVELFNLPIAVAARKLDTCPTVLKKFCRRHGVVRWPYRKLKGLKWEDFTRKSVLETIFTKGIPTELDMKSLALKKKDNVKRKIPVHVQSVVSSPPTSASGSPTKASAPPPLMRDMPIGGRVDPPNMSALAPMHNPIFLNLLSMAYSLGTLQAVQYMKSSEGGTEPTAPNLPFGVVQSSASLLLNTAMRQQPLPPNEGAAGGGATTPPFNPPPLPAAATLQLLHYCNELTCAQPLPVPVPSPTVMPLTSAPTTPTAGTPLSPTEGATAATPTVTSSTGGVGGEKEESEGRSSGVSTAVGSKK